VDLGKLRRDLVYLDNRSRPSLIHHFLNDYPIVSNFNPSRYFGQDKFDIGV
jgi:hypothetical protein